MIVPTRCPDTDLRSSRQPRLLAIERIPQQGGESTAKVRSAEFGNTLSFPDILRISTGGHGLFLNGLGRVKLPGILVES